MSFTDRKAKRTKEYLLRKDARKKFCYACNGTGYYDNTGSPKCSCCGGKGWYIDSKPPDYKEYLLDEWFF